MNPTVEAHLTTPREPAPLTARVSEGGSLVEADGREGVALLALLEPLGAYARAFLKTGLRDLRFLWVDGGRRWYAVRLSRERGSVERPAAGALVELEPVRPPFGLTLRELDVLTLLCGGLSNPEIASQIGSSARTISTHVAHVLSKLDQSSRGGAAAIAVDWGLLRLPVPGGGRALGALGVGMVDQVASGLAPTGRPPDAAWRRVLRSQRRAIRLGTLLDTATDGGDGDEVRDGSALAIAAINGRGGVAGRKVDQVLVDVDVRDAASFAAGLERLVTADVDAILCGYAHYVAPGLYQSVRDHGCPILTTMTSAEQARWVREDPDRYGRVFQVCPTEVNYGTGAIAFLDHAVSAGWQPIGRAVLPIETGVDGGQPFTTATRALAERSGWSVLDGVVVPLTAVDWPQTLATVLREEPAAIVLTHFIPDEAAAFQRAFVASGARSLVYMVYTPSTPAFERAAGAAAEGVVWATVTGTLQDGGGRAFQARYLAAFGRPPGRALAGSAYDQVHMLATAWALAGDARQFADVARELRALRYRGVNGAYDLGASDQTGRAYPLETADPSLGLAHLVYQIQRGHHRVLHPALYADGRFRPPPWMHPDAGE